MGGTEPILCSGMIRLVDERLVEMLKSLTPEEWELPTIAPQWKVREVAAHLLDTALRKLSGGRDQWRAKKVEIRTHQDVVNLVNRLNREGVTVYRRLSPAVLIELMQLACAQTADYYESLDPFARAAIGVSWAGEMSSLVWFDTARELTERWHHQQQIRLATDRHGIMTRPLYYPVLDTFLRGLPYTYRDVPSTPGTAILIEVSGECGGRWCLVRAEDQWELRSQVPVDLAAHVTIPQEIAWRVFTKGIDREAARCQVLVTGNRALGERVLELVAIVG